MLSTIHLDDDLCFETDEIENELFVGMLPPELVAFELTATQRAPEMALRSGHVIAQHTGTFEWNVSPTRLASHARLTA